MQQLTPAESSWLMSYAWYSKWRAAAAAAAAATPNNNKRDQHNNNNNNGSWAGVLVTPSAAALLRQQLQVLGSSSSSLTPAPPRPRTRHQDTLEVFHCFFVSHESCSSLSSLSLSFLSPRTSASPFEVGVTDLKVNLKYRPNVLPSAPPAPGHALRLENH